MSNLTIFSILNLKTCLSQTTSYNKFLFATAAKRYTYFYTTSSNIAKRKLSSSSSVNVLGIETSCDDTGVAILNSKGIILGESLYSQQELHAKHGGIIPPLARELHKENIKRAVNEALNKSNLTMEEIDAVAVTNCPGLPLSLLVGVNEGKHLAKTYGKPLIPIHHMEAHALTIRMIEKVRFPFLVLLISGGHSLIGIARDVNKFLLLGATLDDAPGEAFDKIARRLKLRNLEEFCKMAGGQAIELAASKGDPLSFPIAEPMTQYRDCNFSFAGIKNSARRTILDEEKRHGIEGDQVLPNVFHICASVQFGIVKHLCRRVLRAMAFAEAKNLLPLDCKTLVVSGGVACNNYIGRALKFIGSQQGFSVLIPPRHLCTDNGVMIAWNGVEKFNRGIDIHTSEESINLVDIQSRCPLGEDIRDQVASTSLKSPPLKLNEFLSVG